MLYNVFLFSAYPIMSNKEPPTKLYEVSSTAMRYLQLLEIPDDPNKTRIITRNCDETTVNNQWEEATCTTEDSCNRSFSKFGELEFTEANHLTMFDTPNDFHILNINDESINKFDPSMSFVLSDVYQSGSSHDFLESPPKKRLRHQQVEVDTLVQTSFSQNLESYNEIRSDIETTFLFRDRTVAQQIPIDQKPLESFETSLPSDSDFKLFESNDETKHSGEELEASEQPVEQDESESFDKSDEFIDESLIPERCRNKILEKTIMQNEKLVVDTSYVSRYIMKDKNVIDDFYKVHKFEDWNLNSEDIAAMGAAMMEPSLDYLHVKFNLPMTVHLGEREQEIGEDEFSCEEICESLQEIEDSFEAPDRSIVTSTRPSTPDRALSIKQTDLEGPDKSQTMTRLEEVIKSRSEPDLTSVSASIDETRVSGIVQSSVQPSTSIYKGEEEIEIEATATDMYAPNFNFSDIDPNEFMFSLVNNNVPNVVPLSTDAGNKNRDEEQEFRGFTPEEQLADIAQGLQFRRVLEDLGILSQQNPA